MDQIEFIIRAVPNLLLGYPSDRPGGLLLSLLLGALAVGAGLVLALPLGVARFSARRWLSWPAAFIIQAIRGIPLVLLLVGVHILASPSILGIDLAPAASASIALTLYAAVYQAEVVHAGLRSVPHGQLEAARSSGLTAVQAMRFIILPQALRAMLPAFAGQAVSIFKDTSVVVVLGVGELMMVGRTIGSQNNEGHYLTLYAFIGLLYFLVAYTISHAARRFERDTSTSRMLWLTYEA